MATFCNPGLTILRGMVANARRRHRNSTSERQTWCHDRRVKVLLVDAANFVGSVPDGWWRDRAGATARLHARLVAADLPFDEVVLVLEGKSRTGVPVGTVGRTTTVHAAASGDDEIVVNCQRLADAGAAVTVVSADRGLLGRIAPLGVATVGPRTLLGWMAAA